MTLKEIEYSKSMYIFVEGMYKDSVSPFTYL